MFHPDIEGDIGFNFFKDGVDGVLHALDELRTLFEDLFGHVRTGKLTVAVFDLQADELHHALLLCTETFDEFRRLPFDVGGHVLEDIFLKENPVFVFFKNIRDVFDNEEIFEIVITADFDVGKDGVDFLHGAVDLFHHVIMIEINLTTNRFRQFAVFIVKPKLILDTFGGFCLYFSSNSQCGKHLHRKAGFFVHLVLNELFQCLKTAFLPHLLRHGRTGLFRKTGGDRDDGDLHIQRLFRTAPHEVDHLIPVFLRFQKVDLVEDQDGFLAPVADTLQKFVLTFGKRPIRRAEEDYHIRAGKEPTGQNFMLLNHCVRPGCVYKADIFQQVHRQFDHQPPVFNWVNRFCFAITDQVDLRGCGGDAFSQFVGIQ